ncbi:hypothetical protein HK097_001964 [Rhizophlyctis rosea]|uniref:DUF218 domain-containing protein n=1 Tax=Rhizophlyctis rosea TaxID=64517 RepID=A0AAD5S673_9FUNG|nr:hypothetical protein HK097_001964 [Rhizophlyctis rosea]
MLSANQSTLHPPIHDSEVDAAAKLIYNYHRMHQPLPTSPDAILCLCSLDTRVAKHAAELFLSLNAPLLIFSGNVGALTAGKFDKPEADVFADIAISMGVPRGKILIENKSTNTGQNIVYTHSLLSSHHLSLQSIVLVQIPYMERRTYATFLKQWPQQSVLPTFVVSSPMLEWEDYPDEANPWELVINIMVGDLVRDREYPKRGFQVEMEIPEKVWEAGQWLVGRGFDGHLP